MFESKAGVLLVGGLGFFLFAFISNALTPIYMFQNLPERSVKDLVNPNLMYEVEDLSRRFPDEFKRHYGEPTPETATELLHLGREIYVGEGCWHCHSQFIRPVSNESRRWGPVSETWEYQNELQRPVMFGTRRVGPDLSREGGRRSNDWHATHLFQPTLTSTGSPMPEYTWFFDGRRTNRTNAGWPCSPTFSGLVLGSMFIRITRIINRSINSSRRCSRPARKNDLRWYSTFVPFKKQFSELPCIDTYLYPRILGGPGSERSSPLHFCFRVCGALARSFAS